MKKPSIRTLGVFATIAGIGLTLLNSFVNEKQTDAKIEEKVQKALAEQMKKG